MFKRKPGALDRILGALTDGTLLWHRDTPPSWAHEVVRLPIQSDELLAHYRGVRFDRLADWIAQKAGGIDRNEELRERALLELEQSILDGEFGPVHRPTVRYLPEARARGEAARAARFTGVQAIIDLRRMGRPVAADLFTTRPLALAWFHARQITPPPWLKRDDRQPVTIEGEVVQEVPALPAAPARTPKRSGGKVEAEFKAWAAAQNPYPSKRKAETWAQECNVSTTLARKWQSAGTSRSPGQR